MKITWLGHSCFTVESQGCKIVLDPYQDGSVPGLAPLREEAGQVLCSHGHGDHCGTECVSLRQGGLSPFTVETIDTWHDDKNGTKRGPNTIHILSDDVVTYPGSELELIPQISRQTAVLKPKNA